jgi:DNA-binding MarR family transcriptional regulator
VQALEIERFLPEQIAILARVISRGMTKVYARHGLEPNEWRVLASLAEEGELAAKSIARKTRMHKTKVSRAVSLLTDRRLIEKRVDTKDMRQTLLSLSPAGRRIFSATVPDAIEFGSKLEAVIAAADAEAFERCVRALQTLAFKLAETANDASPADNQSEFA